MFQQDDCGSRYRVYRCISNVKHFQSPFWVVIATLTNNFMPHTFPSYVVLAIVFSTYARGYLIGQTLPSAFTPVERTFAQQRGFQPHLKDTPSCPLTVTLMPRHCTANLGGEVVVEITLMNQSDRFLELYNPFFDRLLMARQRAAELAISRDDGSNIGDLFTFRGGSALAGPRKMDWIRVPPAGRIGTSFKFLAGSVPGTEYFVGRELPTGRYFVDLRIREPVITGPPLAVTQIEDPLEAMRHSTYLQWLQSFPGREICRSNRVELEILPRTGD
jgi:hypothetical protein